MTERKMRALPNCEGFKGSNCEKTQGLSSSKGSKHYAEEKKHHGDYRYMSVPLVARASTQAHQ